jgi:hypothetical protein
LISTGGIMKTIKIWLMITLLISFASISNGQLLQTGSVKGVITDVEKAPIPGASITVTGPALIGSVTDISRADGAYRCLGLPPGTYTVSAELAGFQTIKREGIVVNVGVTVTINFELKPSAVKEEITVVAPTPTVDLQSTKISTSVTGDFIQNLPVSRDLTTIVNAMPSVVARRSYTIRAHSSISGGGYVSQAVQVDGVTVNDPSMNEMLIDVQYDSMEEVEIAAGGLPAQIGNTSGAFVNIVTKSGGNDFHGQVQTYYTNEHIVNIPIPDFQINAMGVVKPPSPILDSNTSGNLGGPILKDKLWFYSSVAFRKEKEHGTFIPAVIQGKQYNSYDFSYRRWEGLFKLTSQISKSLRFFVMFVGSDLNEPYWGSLPTWTSDAIVGQIFRRYAATANLSWQWGSNTILDFRAGYAALDYPIPMQPGTENSPTFADYYTGYQWGAGDFNHHIWRPTSQASILLTHFKDDFLGGDHEFKAGVEFKTAEDKWDWTRGGDQITEWAFYNGNPYYYRGLLGLTGPSPIYGDGLLSFAPCGPKEGDTYAEAKQIMFGAFVQDSWTIKQRLTLNLGVRVDAYRGNIPAITKNASSPLAVAIGAYYFAPLYGINPFDKFSTPEWKNPMGPTSVSPRIGLSYDPFGDGKTALKASYSRYTENILPGYFEIAEPFFPTSFTFDWFDLNNNGVPDAPPIDKYNLHPADVRGYSPSYYMQKIAPGTKAPLWQELIVGVQRELVQNFKIGLQFVYKKLSNYLASDVLYDPESKRFLYTYALASDFWAPFTTTVPATGSFSEKTLTMYFPKNNHPDWFTVIANVPEGYMKYQALELTLNKRMTKGWQLGGSVTISKAYGTMGDQRTAFTGNDGRTPITPDYWVNKDGRKEIDRPLVIKLYGTFSLPLGFLFSYNYRYEPGIPFGRTVTVYPPEQWAAANNVRLEPYTVYVDSVGFGRNPSLSLLDVRLEKRFDLTKNHNIGIFVDVLNLLGSYNVYVGNNPGGTWQPADENTNIGVYTTSYWFGKVTGIDGARILKVSIRYTF